METTKACKLCKDLCEIHQQNMKNIFLEIFSSCKEIIKQKWANELNYPKVGVHDKCSWFKAHTNQTKYLFIHKPSTSNHGHPHKMFRVGAQKTPK